MEEKKKSTLMEEKKMNKNIYLLLVFFLTLLGMTSCEKDTPLPYDGTTGITFQPISMFTDIVSSETKYPSESDTCFTKEFFFTYDEDPDSYRVLTIPVAALGYTVGFDRPVSIEIDSATTLPADRYEVATDQCSISADNARGLLSILVKRPDTKEEKTLQLVLRMKPNAYFSYVLETGSTFVCKLSNTNHKPQYWDANMVNGINMTQNFGIYSNNKFEFIHQTLYDYAKENDYTGEETYPYREYATLEGFRKLSGRFSICSDIQDVLQAAYKSYKEKGGKPILDENTGKEIVFEY